MEWKIEAEICAGFALFFTCTSQKMYSRSFVKSWFHPLERYCSIFLKVSVQSFGKLLYNLLDSGCFAVSNMKSLHCRLQWDLNVMLCHHLEGDCESRYGEVATFAEQVCPGNCH